MRRGVQLLVFTIIACIPFSHKDILAQTSLPALFPNARRDYLVPSGQPNRLTAADVNSDGKPDLIASCGSNAPFQARIFKATGSSFQDPTIVPLFGSVITGDFNNDSKLDLVSTEVTIALGNGNGTFQATSYTPVAGADCSVSSDNIATSDFNKDGKLDVVVAAPNGLNVLLGNGNGTLQAPITLAVGGAEAVAVVVGDFNQDTNLDLIAATNKANNRLYTFLGGGNGTFQTPTTVDTCALRDITAADVNRDGKLDVAGVCNGFTNSLQMYYGQGNGTFSFVQTVNPSNIHPWSVQAADLNGDNNPDLIVIGGDSNSGQASILLGNGTMTFQAPITYPLPDTLPQGIAVADFDANGTLDLAMGNRISKSIGGFFMVLRGVGNGTFTQAPPLGGVNDAEGVATGDFNQDTNLDLAAVNYTTNDVSIYLGTGTGTFAAAIRYATGAGPSAVTVGDFNKDGKMDLAVANQVANSISILLGNGNGSFQSPSAFALTPNFHPSSIVSGDFNLDGNLDLASEGAGSIAVLQGTSDGSFQVAGTIAGFGSSTSTAFARYLNNLAVGDFNRDGKLDIAALSYGFGDDDVAILIGNGDFTFRSDLSYRVQSNPSHIIAADFNKDGILDLASVSIDDDVVSVLIGLGNGRFWPHEDYNVGLMPSYVAAADLNKDNTIDIAAVNVYSGNVSVLYGNGTGTFAPANYYGTPEAYAIAIGDWNKDSANDFATVGSTLQTTFIGQPPPSRKGHGQITSN